MWEKDKAQEQPRGRGRAQPGGDHQGCRWPEEEMASNQNLDLDFARKVMDFKLAEVEAGSMNSQVPTQQFRIMPGTAIGIS
jgi:hypothetical protein